MIINFWGNLKELLWPPFRGQKRVEYDLTRQASVKDIIEALGVPHTEVGRLIVAGQEISFSPCGCNDPNPYLVREIYPERQLAEIVHLFGIKGQFKPLSRCLRCNGLLQPVAKEEIIEQLEPLTKKYYDSFRRCLGCGKIYWPGTHRDKMLLVLNRYGDYHDLA
jgi:uncharacterized protein with PIN domain